jgi:hypothetical protein
MQMRVLVAVALVGAAFGLAGCAGAAHSKLGSRPVGSPEWHAVLSDWYDGRISGHHSCAAVVVASAHLPSDGPPIGSSVIVDLSGYAQKVCSGHRDLAAVKAGMSDTDVVRLGGPPQIPASGSCWDYRDSHDGHKDSRVCFRDGRVTAVSTTYHRVPLGSHVGAICHLKNLGASAGLQGATGSQLGGISLRNLGSPCTLAGIPIVELRWRDRRVTPLQRPFDPRAVRSIGPFHPKRLLLHEGIAFVWMQWWNYCGPAPWGRGGFRPVAVLRVEDEPGALRVRFHDLVVAPFCNAPRDSRFFVSDFEKSP